MDSKATNVQRKRRLSKKERKALKKKQKIDNKPTGSALNNEKNESNGERNQDSQENEEEMMKSYKAIKVPTKPSAEILSSKGIKTSSQFDNDDEGGGGGVGGGERKLGAWFPNALLVKCKFGYTNTGKLLTYGVSDSEDIKTGDSPKSSLLLFYQYTNTKKWTQDQVKILMTYMATIGKERNLGGRIRVAQEGVNATLSAVDMPHKNGLKACEILRHVAQDLKNFDPDVFTSNTDFKYIDDLSADRHFKELKIVPVQELVYYGIREEDASCNQGGVHLDAKEYHEMLKKDNTVVIDVRNHYETILGRFDGQESQKTTKSHKNDGKKVESKCSSGAEYIDPKMRKSTDFTSWLSKSSTKEKLKEKTVLMFCTGGIRCERASAYLKKEMGESVEGVYQLQGGIERYLKAFPDGGFWTGSNFVFDKREAVSANAKDGCGGVIRKSKKGKSKATSGNGSEASKCCVCGIKWDRYVGKKKCYTCGVPVLMCDKCMSQKPDKIPAMMLKVRCPLCVEENITIPASKVEFTENGVKSKIGNVDEANANEKSATSVCKWGGGHAKQKKLDRKIRRLANYQGNNSM